MNRDPASPDISSFWIHCQKGVLALQRCLSCRQWRLPPAAVCSRCGSDQSVWEEASGEAKLVSFAVYRRDFGAGLELPYLVALVQLKEGPRLISRLIECVPEDVATGANLRLEFRRGPDGKLLPLFRLQTSD